MIYAISIKKLYHSYSIGCITNNEKKVFTQLCNDLIKFKFAIEGQEKNNFQNLSPETHSEIIASFFDQQHKDFIVTPQMPLYDLFLIYAVGSIDLIEVDNFLNFHLVNYFGGKKNNFNRYLKIAIRKNDHIPIGSKNLITIAEWQDLSISDNSFVEQPKLNILKNENDSSQALFGVEQAAKFLGICKPTLYSKTSKKEIPHLKKGKKIYFSKAELEAWLLAGKVATNEELESEAITHLFRKKKTFK